MVNPLVSYYGSNKVPTYFMIFLGVIFLQKCRLNSKAIPFTNISAWLTLEETSYTQFVSSWSHFYIIVSNTSSFFIIWNFIHCNAKMLRTIWQFYLRDLLKKGKKIILRTEEMTSLFLWISNRNFVIRLLSCGLESSIAKHI